MITRFRNVFFGVQAKIVVFTVILVPCLLQFPLISFGQDGVDIIDSGLNIVEVNREHVESVDAVMNERNLVSKNSFVLKNVGTEEALFTSSDSKNVIDSLRKPNSNDSGDKSSDGAIKPSFFHRQFVDPFHYEPADSILFWAFVIFMCELAI